jgi:hypothetical protein
VYVGPMVKSPSPSVPASGADASAPIIEAPSLVASAPLRDPPAAASGMGPVPPTPLCDPPVPALPPDELPPDELASALAAPPDPGAPPLPPLPSPAPPFPEEAPLAPPLPPRLSFSAEPLSPEPHALTRRKSEAAAQRRMDVMACHFPWEKRGWPRLSSGLSICNLQATSEAAAHVVQKAWKAHGKLGLSI